MSQTLSARESALHEEQGAAVSVVIPLYNEQTIIDQNLETLAAFFDEIIGAGKWLFILVDNGSKDETPAKVRAALERWPLSRSVDLPEPNYGAALRAGLSAASTRWVYLLDIEQWDLPFMAWAWFNRDSYDLFLASKRSDPTLNFQTTYRRILSTCLNGLLQALLGFSGTDTHGPKLIDRRSMADLIGLCTLDRGHFDTEMVLRAIRSQKRIVEIPVVYRENRPHRNWMVKKIVWNLLALRRLVNVMESVPYEGLIRYRRLTREDVLGEIEMVEPTLAKTESV